MNLLVFSEFVRSGVGFDGSGFEDHPCQSGCVELGVWGRSRVGDRRVFW